MTLQQHLLHIKTTLHSAPHHTRGMLLGAISKRFDTIAQFTAFEDFISFDRKGKNKVKRVENNKIKVTIEVGMVCGAVK